MIDNRDIKIAGLIGAALIFIGLVVEGLLPVFAVGLGTVMVATLMAWVRFIQLVRLERKIRRSREDD